MDFERSIIDPEGRYPSLELRHFERIALQIRDFLPHGLRLDRTRDAIQIDWNDQEEITILITPEAVEFRLATVDWIGPHSPVPSSKLWKRVPIYELTEEALPSLINEAREARRAEYLPCRFCGQLVPPEHRIEGDVCHSCAERHLGIVF